MFAFQLFLAQITLHGYVVCLCWIGRVHLRGILQVVLSRKMSLDHNMSYSFFRKRTGIKVIFVCPSPDQNYLV